MRKRFQRFVRFNLVHRVFSHVNPIKNRFSSSTKANIDSRPGLLLRLTGLPNVHKKEMASSSIIQPNAHQNQNQNCQTCTFLRQWEKIVKLYTHYYPMNLFPTWFAEWKNEHLLNSFLASVIPLLNEKDASGVYANDHKLKYWLRFWHRNMEKHTAEELIGRLKYLSPNLIKYLAHYDDEVFDFLAHGNNIRKYKPSEYFFTKKMAHIYHNTDMPGSPLYLESQCRHCLIESMTKDDIGIKALLQLYNLDLGTTKKAFDALQQIVAKFKSWNITNLDRELQSRIMGYLTHGYDDIPDFSLKHTTLKSITRQVDAYYAEQQNRQKFGISEKYRRWEGVGQKNFTYKHQNEVYHIIQLKSAEALIIEGQKLHHCVASYAGDCAKGLTSIWSMRDSTGKRMVTIQLKGKKNIQQVRGKFNRAPNQLENHIIRAWKAKMSSLEFMTSKDQAAQKSKMIDLHIKESQKKLSQYEKMIEFPEYRNHLTGVKIPWITSD